MGKKNITLFALTLRTIESAGHDQKMEVLFCFTCIMSRYLTNKEWREEWGGKKAGKKLNSPINSPKKLVYSSFLTTTLNCNSCTVYLLFCISHGCISFVIYLRLYLRSFSLGFRRAIF